MLNSNRGGATKSELGASRSVRNGGSSFAIGSNLKPTTLGSKDGERYTRQILVPPTIQRSQIQSHVNKAQATCNTAKEFAVTPSPQATTMSQSLNGHSYAAYTPSNATNSTSATGFQVQRKAEPCLVPRVERAAGEASRSQAPVFNAPASGDPARDRLFGEFSSVRQLTPRQRLTTNPGSWMKENRQQQRSQQRAFATLKDNPFNRFKHDPNDSEAQLEHLSAKSPIASNDSVIPPKRLRMLDDAYRLNSAPGDRQDQDHWSARRAARRQVGANLLPTGRELLSLKAAEMNSRGSSDRPPFYSPFVEDSSTILQRSFSAGPIPNRYQPIHEEEAASFCYAGPSLGVNSSEDFGHSGNGHPSRSHGRYFLVAPSERMPGTASWAGNVQFTAAADVNDDIHENNFGAFEF